MSDQTLVIARDDATGQYVPAAVPEAEVKLFPEEESLTPEEESALSAPASDIKTYSDLPEGVTLSIEEAANLRAEDRQADEQAHETAELEKFGAEVDELRGVKPEAKAEEATTEPAETAQPGDLDPEIEKALTNPKIQAALSQQVAEVETARQEHALAVEGAGHVAVAAFMAQFPEFANIPPENMSAAIQAMQQQDPARAAQVAATIQRTLHIFDQQKSLRQQEADAKRTTFNNYVQTENEKFNTLVKGESAETLRAAPALIREALEEYGADLGEFGRLLQSSELVNHSVVQRLLIDAAKYRQIMKSKPVASRAALPPVQRPGHSNVTRGDSATLQSLNQQLTTATGDRAARISAQILGIERKARG